MSRYVRDIKRMERNRNARRSTSSEVRPLGLLEDALALEDHVHLVEAWRVNLELGLPIEVISRRGQSHVGGCTR